MKICEWCGKEIPKEEIKSGTQKYHKECRKMVYAERLAQGRESRGKVRYSKTLICAWCGEEILKEEIKSGFQKYHKECAYPAQRAYRKKYMQEKKEYFKSIRDERDWGKRKETKDALPAGHSYIYFIRSTNGLIKIGKTVNIRARFNNLSSSSPVKLELLYCFIGPDFIEKTLHYNFETFKSDISKSHREWFHECDAIYKEIQVLKNHWGTSTFDSIDLSDARRKKGPLSRANIWYREKQDAFIKSKYGHRQN